mmetsp:Transcript_3705/g.9940  ORF Transcript_3705/g.9940 Transcript_3705/m.9940 type:complete len:211 (+) Transcript_3705:2330-2962(+)
MVTSTTLPRGLLDVETMGDTDWTDTSMSCAFRGEAHTSIASPSPSSSSSLLSLRRDRPDASMPGALRPEWFEFSRLGLKPTAPPLKPSSSSSSSLSEPASWSVLSRTIALSKFRALSASSSSVLSAYPSASSSVSPPPSVVSPPPASLPYVPSIASRSMSSSLSVPDWASLLRLLPPSATMAAAPPPTLEGATLAPAPGTLPTTLIPMPS